MSLTDVNGNPVVDVNGNPVDPVTTDASGYYEFTNLVPGTYEVRFDLTTLPENTALVESNVGDDMNDSDPDAG